MMKFMLRANVIICLIVICVVLIKVVIIDDNLIKLSWNFICYLFQQLSDYVLLPEYRFTLRAIYSVEGGKNNFHRFLQVF